MKHISVIGLGYVGAPCAYFFARTCRVTAIDVDDGKLAKIPAGVPLLEPHNFAPLVQKYQANMTVARSITDIEPPDFVFLSTPTNADPKTGALDTRALRDLMAECIHHAPDAIIVVRSTVPVGFMAQMQSAHSAANLVFWPEFVRESRGYVDNVSPDRVIFGGAPEQVKAVRALVQDAFGYDDSLILEMGFKEAELVKLAANAYLATRVAFFNEVDGLARTLGADPAAVNAGICGDKRIGRDYANPSLGFGGYCLPKDTLQFATLSQQSKGTLAAAVLSSNQARMQSFVEVCQERGARRVGFMRLVMKPGSDNAREAASLQIAERLHRQGMAVYAYEPAAHLIPDFITALDQETLFKTCDIVLAESWEGIAPEHRSKTICPDLRA